MIDSSVAIEVVRLSKAFDCQAVLREICFQVAEGESVAITGANGAGKTTLLGCLASIIRPDRGEVRWFGEPAGVRARTRCLVGMASHAGQLYSHLTLRENLIFAARMYGAGRPGQRADQLLASVGLRHCADRLPRQVSQGMRGRVRIVRALVHDPKIVLLDEPFSHLDAEGTEWLERLLRNLGDRGRTVCFATHDRQKSRSFADRVFFLQSGRLEKFIAPSHEAVDIALHGPNAA